MKKQKVILAAIAAVSAASLTHAAIITSVETGSADWDTPSAWSNGEAPSAANDYVGGSGVRVNSPNGGTFAGNSLTLEGSVNFQVGSSDPANVVVINDLRMNGGTFRLRFDVASTGSYGVLQGNMAIQAATTLDTWFGGERSLEIQSLVSGSEAVTINARNTPEFFRFTNAGNTYSGTWNIAAGLAEFSSAGAVGVGSSVDVTSGGTLDIQDDWSGAMSVVDGATVKVGANAFTLDLTANGSAVANGIYSVADLNTEIGSTIFNGTGSIEVIPEPATLGMVAAFGGGILFIRRRFMI